MLNFTKMEDNGNDYIIINNLLKDKEKLKYNKKLLMELCNRNYKIGGNGIIFIDEPLNIKNADVKIKIYNSDGTVGNISGSGIACTAKYLYDNNIIKKENLYIETNAGLKKVVIEEDITINMGKPSLSPKKIPVLTDKNIFINEEIYIENKKYNVTCLSVGNPHAVIFLNNIQKLDLNYIGPALELYYLFPERANIEFVKILEKNNIMIRNWERGNRETLSCQTGACASVVGAILNNYLEKNNEITVYSKGGINKVIYNENEDILIKSNPNKVYDGKILIKL